MSRPPAAHAEAKARPATGLCALSLSGLAAELAAGGVSSQEATAASLARIDETQHLGAWLHVGHEDALAQASASDDHRRAHGPRSPLEGVPVGLKDILQQRGQPTTCASHMLAGYISPFDATVVARLRAAGAILVGKLNMDEFAMGSSNEHSAFGPVRNPWDPQRVAGGSSGGSAAAVAAGDVFASLGTDTGGSIRQPAALCGIVGLKPTYGRVSRYGVVAYASSLDQVGPMAREVRDCALMMQALAGHDPRDATTCATPVPDYAAALAAPAADKSLRGLRVGVLPEAAGDGVDPEVRAGVEAALAQLVARGAQLKEVSLPTTRHGIATYYIIAPAEASSNLSRFDGVRYGQRAAEAHDLTDMLCRTRTAGFGVEVQRRILLGAFVLSSGHYDAYFGRARRVRSQVVADYARVFGEVDLLATPTSPTVAFPLGAKEKDPLQMYLADVYTVGANLAGLPAISVPCTPGPSGLPVGLQLVGPAHSEVRLLQAALALEAATCLGDRWPSC